MSQLENAIPAHGLSEPEIDAAVFQTIRCYMGRRAQKVILQMIYENLPEVPKDEIRRSLARLGTRLDDRPNPFKPSRR